MPGWQHGLMVHHAASRLSRLAAHLRGRPRPAAATPKPQLLRRDAFNRVVKPAVSPTRSPAAAPAEGWRPNGSRRVHGYTPRLFAEGHAPPPSAQQQAAVARFEREGLCVVPGALQGEQLRRTQAGFEAVSLQQPRPSAGIGSNAPLPTA